MRKILVAAVCVMLILWTASAASAAGGLQVTVTPDRDTVRPGEEVTFVVSVSGKDGYTSLGYIPNVSSPVFQVISGKLLAENVALGEFHPVDGGVVAFGSDDSHTGEMFSFTVQILEDAPLGEFTVTREGGVAINNGGSPVAVTLSQGKIAVVSESSEPTTQPTNPHDTEESAPQLEWYLVAVPVVLVVALVIAVVIVKGKQK